MCRRRSRPPGVRSHSYIVLTLNGLAAWAGHSAWCNGRPLMHETAACMGMGPPKNAIPLIACSWSACGVQLPGVHMQLLQGCMHHLELPCLWSCAVMPPHLEPESEVGALPEQETPATAADLAGSVRHNTCAQPQVERSHACCIACTTHNARRPPASSLRGEDTCATGHAREHVASRQPHLEGARQNVLSLLCCIAAGR